MRFIADLHIHSHYSHATSKHMNIVELSQWSQLKGTNLVGTGDFTHPRWFEEMQEKLEPAEPGLFRLKKEFEATIQEEVFESCRTPMRFVLSVEVSTIYRKNDRTRKLHNLLYAPTFQAAAKINAQLNRIGNIRADGRPILGMDAKRLLEITLEADENCLFIPAHAWTPHFSVFGSQSGFDSLEEAFEDLTPYVYAIETGLSSDPAMNWRLSQLDSIALISNSDAHSARNLGREANIFNTELSYYAISEALKTNDLEAFESTIEFFPEEGKYHLDGHRNCQTRMDPLETLEAEGKCSKCGRGVTVGVLSRVEALADRPVGYLPERYRPFRSIIPLPNIISEVVKVGLTSKKVSAIHTKMLAELGNEFYILLDAPIADIERAAGSVLAEAIRRMREGKVKLFGGYDGEYGTIEIFTEKERAKLKGEQVAMF